MVRTTDTGGIKMIYNGITMGNGETCENTTTASRNLSGTYVFNSNSNSLSDVGYMSNKRYPYHEENAIEGAYFGSGVSYDDDNEVYTLVGTSDDYKEPDAQHHYTCNSTNINGTCEIVRYYYYDGFYIELTGGEKIEDALYKMTGNGDNAVKARNASYVLNQNDSYIKSAIESWFKSNLTNEEDNTKMDYRPYLEDTVFCNDRVYQINGEHSFSASGWNANGGNLTTSLYFNVSTRFQNNNWYSNQNIPTLSCENETDRFSMNNTKAHLNYPVGMLTADEAILAGVSGNSTTNNTSFYLYTGAYFRTITPAFFNRLGAAGIEGVNGKLGSDNTDYPRYIRPVISLRKGIEFESGGEGTSIKPYVVKIN